MLILYLGLAVAVHPLHEKKAVALGKGCTITQGALRSKLINCSNRSDNGAGI